MRMVERTPYSHGTQEISFKLHSFEMSWRLMGQWTNSNICRTVTDGQFCHANMSRCTFDPIGQVRAAARAVIGHGCGQFKQPLTFYILSVEMAISLRLLENSDTNFLLWHILRISNSVTHLQSHTNTTIADIPRNCKPGAGIAMPSAGVATAKADVTASSINVAAPT